MITIDLSENQRPLFHLQTNETSYVMTVSSTGHLIQLHYGARIQHTPYLRQLERNFTVGLGSSTAYSEKSALTLDAMRLEAPGYGKGDYRVPMVMLHMDRGERISDFVYEGYYHHQNKCSPEGMPHVRGTHEGGTAADTLEIILREVGEPVTLHLYYTVVDTSNAIIRFNRIVNHGETAVEVRSLMSGSTDFEHASFECTSLDGMWIRERQVNTRPLRPGLFTIDSKKGVSGANHNPFLALKSPSADEHQGEVYGFALMYSGNHVCRVEVSPYSMTRVQMGISDFDFTWHLAPTESFDTPEMVMVFSENGFNGMSQAFHHLIETQVVGRKWRKKERPILINNWEATYFDFNERKLLRLAKEAKQLGIELFVLDDGWFKGRNDDKTSLGDWVCDEKKLPGGLKQLSQKIRQMGLAFGIWVEPEMVSPRSDLYKAHPEWAIGLPDRAPSLGRNQLILDLSNHEVVDYLYEAISRILIETEATYVKWDMNRNFSDLFSQTLTVHRQTAIAHLYVLGLYELLERLTLRFPEILFESCSSGGNRFDMGMLYYMPQTWTSDNTDAIERLEIQYGTSYVFPLSTMGAHVSGRPSHQVLRSTPLETRFNVAAFGLLGYELDLTRLSYYEKKVIAKQISYYKKHRALLQFGRFYRQSSPFEGNHCVWSVVSDTSFIMGYYQKLQRPSPPLETVRLVGIAPNKVYEIESRKQFHQITLFGELINAYLPIKIKDGGILQSIVSNRTLYPAEQQRFTQSGDALTKVGMKLYAPFAGTGIDDQTMILGDFGSRIYHGIIQGDPI